MHACKHAFAWFLELLATHAHQPGALLHLRGSPGNTTARSVSCHQKQQPRADTHVFALNRDQRKAPAVAEAVRQRCSHIAATKADQAYGVMCAVSKVERTRLQCLSVTSQLVGQYQQVSFVALAAKRLP